jgi:small subunit ribosomal protein S13
MPRIAGVNLNPQKRIVIALTYIFGIGKKTAQDILKQANIKEDIRTKDLSENEIEKIREIVEKKYKVEGALRSEITLNIKRLKEIGAYRGLRHSKNLPVRGQKTRSNARTKRGKKVTMATARKVATEKT